MAPAQVRGRQLVCKLRFGGWGMGGGLPAAGAKILAIFSVNHCILALKVMPHTTIIRVSGRSRLLRGAVRRLSCSPQAPTIDV